MTCRIDEILRATGEKRAQRGIELYRFRDGRLALKDVYRKPIAVSGGAHTCCPPLMWISAPFT